MNEKQDAQQLANDFSLFVNTYNGGKNKEFVDAMAFEHRTLQQSFTRLCCAWFQKLASYTPGMIDDRNRASVELAKKLQPIIEDNRLPLI